MPGGMLLFYFEYFYLIRLIMRASSEWMVTTKLIQSVIKLNQLYIRVAYKILFEFLNKVEEDVDLALEAAIEIPSDEPVSPGDRVVYHPVGKASQVSLGQVTDTVGGRSNVHASKENPRFVIQNENTGKETAYKRDSIIEKLPSKLDEAELIGLDASLKKNSSFVKKLRNINEDSKASLLKEFSGLKLSKYISEAVACILENKWKLSDVPAAVEVVSAMHQRYSDFSTLLEESLLGVLEVEKDKDEEKVQARIAKQRPFFKLYIELVLVEVFKNPQKLLEKFKELIAEDQLQRGIAFPLVSMVLKNYESELFPGSKSKVCIPNHQMEGFQQLIVQYHRILALSYVDVFRRMKKTEERHKEFYNTRGDLSENQKASYSKMVAVYTKLSANLKMYYIFLIRLCEFLKQEMPELPSENVTRIEGSITFSTDKGESKDKESEQLTAFESEEDRAFYMDLFDLKLVVPAALLRLNSKEAEVENDAREDDLPPDAEVDSLDLKSEDALLESPSADLSPVDEDPDAAIDPETANEAEPASRNKALDDFLSGLPELQSRDLVDKAAVQFCYFGTKSSRKRLVRALLNIPKNRLDIIPYYSRLLATVSRYYREVGEAVCDELLKEFKGLAKKKEPRYLELKIRVSSADFKNAKYLSELTKHKVLSHGSTFLCLKYLIDDFSHCSIDLACSLLEGCGRFLFFNPETHTRISNLLIIMNKKKASMNLDPRQSLLIENAYFTCNPEERPKVVRKKRNAMQEYINFLLYIKLTKETEALVTEELRKLDWNDDSVAKYLMKMFCKIWKVKYSNVHLMAQVAAKLSRYNSNFGVELVDTLLEGIRIGLESDSFRDNQKRISQVKYLGELFNQKLVDSETILGTLYTIVSLGHEQGLPVSDKPNYLDSPEDSFRIRLVCTLLFSLDQLVVDESTLNSLDKFIVYFDYYMKTKQNLSKDVQFIIDDLFDELFPCYARASSLTEAASNLERLVIRKETLEKSKKIPLNTRKEENGSAGSLEQSESEEEESSAESSGEEFDEEFDKEFAKIVSSSIEARKYEKKNIDMPIPMGLFSDKKAGSHFTLLLKKKKKQHAREISLNEASISQKVLMKQHENKQEMKKIKQLVLEYHESSSAAVVIPKKIHYGSVSHQMNYK